jgi:hypothetical protein
VPVPNSANAGAVVRRSSGPTQPGSPPCPETVTWLSANVSVIAADNRIPELPSNFAGFVQIARAAHFGVERARILMRQL